MERDDIDSPLERMRKKLYGSKPNFKVARSEATTTPIVEAEHWKAADPLPVRTKPRMSGTVLFLMVAAGFFAVAGVTAAVILFLGGRSVSTDHVVISVEAPTAIAGGESVPLLITVKNGNPVIANGAMLEIDFPDGTRGEDGAELAHHSDSLGDIPAGGSVTRTVKASFLGSENQKLSVPLRVQYRAADSNAVFIAKETYDFTIRTAPVGLDVTTLSEIASGQTLTMTLVVRSNSGSVLPRVAVKPQYPFGFSLGSTSPAASSGVIAVGDLAPGEEKEIRITGTLSGQSGEQRVFKFVAGTLAADSNNFAISYVTKDAAVALAEPFLALGLAVDQASADPAIAPMGQPVSTSLSFKNELTDPIRDAKITIALSGSALDAGSVSTSGGFYRSSDSTVVFDRDTLPNLANLEPGNSGVGSFTFSAKSGSAGAALRNPSVTLTVSASGRRSGAGNVSSTITSTLTRTVKFQTALGLTSRIVRSGSAYSNTGPVPPKADTETTYAVLLSATNSVNTVANAKSVMTLPSYVRFVKGDSSVTYDEASRTVTWAIGDFAPGATKSAAFQVAFLPSVSQKGTSPVLVSEGTLTGVDRFVQKEVRATAPALDTRFSTDSTYQTTYGIVQ